jgi:hypothetical protein
VTGPLPSNTVGLHPFVTVFYDWTGFGYLRIVTVLVA